MASSSSSAPAPSSKPSRRSAAREGVARLMRTPAKIMVPRLLFIAAVVLLCIIGLVVVYSASSVQAYSDTGDPAFYVRRQAVFLLIGIAFCIFFARVPYAFWSHTFLFAGLWVVTTLLLVATQIGFGTQVLGAERSIVIGGVALQPAEFAKITTVFAVCCLVTRYRSGLLEFKHFMVALIVAIAVPILLIFRQPDLGTVIILFIGLLAATILAGLPWKVVFIGLGVIAFYAVFVCIVQPYHLDRLKTLIDPWSDPSDTGYQTIQSLYALALGGTNGAGLGLSQEKYLYLPYAHTDFIFAVIGEEFGLVGTVAIVLLFALFTYAGIRICRNAPDMLGCTVAGSLTVMVAFQACVNMGCVIGLLPVTGKALPFLSYGGSSLVATLTMVGLVLSVSFSSRVNAQSEKRRAALHVVGSAPGEGGQAGAGASSHGERERRAAVRASGEATSRFGRVRGGESASRGERARGSERAHDGEKASHTGESRRARSGKTRQADGRDSGRRYGRESRGSAQEIRASGRPARQATESSRTSGRTSGRTHSGGTARNTASHGNAGRGNTTHDGAAHGNARHDTGRGNAHGPGASRGDTSSARGYSRKGR